MARINVMVVDDEERFLVTTSKLLKKKNFEVIQATGAIKAIELMDRLPVEVMLLDVKMPGMSGLEALEQIKRYHPFVQVIMLTGHLGLASTAAELRPRVFDCFLKPVDLNKLALNIKNAYTLNCRMKEENKQVWKKGNHNMAMIF